MIRVHLGGFTAHETLLHCNQCANQITYEAEDLSRWSRRAALLAMMW